MRRARGTRFRTAIGAVVIALMASSSAHGQDPFPTGQDKAEAVAADYARAFAKGDADLLKRVVVRNFMSGRPGEEYARFQRELADHVGNKTMSKSDPNNPEKIVKVYAARHLTKQGPASTGYALSGFQDVVFVDVVVRLRSGSEFTQRTLVIKDRDGKWYVDPRPDLSPLLSGGLDEESPSKRVFGSE